MELEQRILQQTVIAKQPARARHLMLEIPTQVEQLSFISKGSPAVVSVSESQTKFYVIYEFDKKLKKVE